MVNAYNIKAEDLTLHCPADLQDGVTLVYRGTPSCGNWFLEKKWGWGGGGDAEDISYDNSSSWLNSTDVQSAIDEVYAKIKDLVFEAVVSMSNNTPVIIEHNLNIKNPLVTIRDSNGNIVDMTVKTVGLNKIEVTSTLSGTYYVAIGTKH